VDGEFVVAAGHGSALFELRDCSADLVPHHLRAGTGAGDRRGTWLQQLADAADDRRRELGTQTAEQAPPWALAALGPVRTAPR